MQDYNARGTIFRIFSKSPGVFTFVFKTIEQHPITLKAKKFKPKDMDEQTFLAMCEVFAQDQIISLRNCRISTEKVMKGDQPLLTSEGQPVYVPVIIVDFMSLEAASIHYTPKQASTPPSAEPAPPQVPVPSAEPRPAPAPAHTPAPQPVSHSVDQSHDDIPTIPFLQ